MFSILTLFWALCFLCLINMIRFIHPPGITLGPA